MILSIFSVETMCILQSLQSQGVWSGMFEEPEFHSNLFISLLQSYPSRLQAFWEACAFQLNIKSIWS